MVQNSGFRVQGSGFGFEGLGGVCGLGAIVWMDQLLIILIHLHLGFQVSHCGARFFHQSQLTSSN